MMKKKTWNAGCMILISLMICTILSIRIEKWMQIPVEIATISQTEEEKLNSTIRIPKSCYNTDTNMIFYLAEQEGVFGTKFLAFSKAVDPLSITADSILLPEEKDEKGQLLQIIKWSTYPLKDGENNLKVIEDIEEISARFIVNKVSLKFKNEIIEKIIGKVREAI